MRPEIAVPGICALLYRAWSRKSLTPAGLVVAGLTASLHALHPWSVFFALLGVFFLAGTAVTKVKHNVKAGLTLMAQATPSQKTEGKKGGSAEGGEGPRNHVQVLANSLVASVLILLHGRKIHRYGSVDPEDACWRRGSDVLVVGIVAQYCAVAADTFSSELGILSSTSPRLITSPTLRKVPRGTNGGVTAMGLAAGLAGGALLAVVATLLIPFCSEPESLQHYLARQSTLPRSAGAWNGTQVATFTLAMALAGLFGSVLDSILGALLQASVVDVASGKVVEGAGGARVAVDTARDAASSVSPGTQSRRIDTGLDVLSNNQVNLLMAALTSLIAMLVACRVWNVPLSDVVFN